MTMTVVYNTDPANIPVIRSNALKPLFEALGLDPTSVTRMIFDARFGGLFDIEVAGFVRDDDGRLTVNAEGDPIAFRAEYRIDWSEVDTAEPPEAA